MGDASASYCDGGLGRGGFVLGSGSRILHLQLSTATWSKEDKGTLADVSRKS